MALHRALMELQALKEALHQAEIAEATQAARVIELAGGRTQGGRHAATVIQAGFHGYMARSYVRGLREEDDLNHYAATVIQAGLHGLLARRAMHEERAHRRELRAAATIQARAVGKRVRESCREMRSSSSARSVRASDAIAGGPPRLQ